MYALSAREKRLSVLTFGPRPKLLAIIAILSVFLVSSVSSSAFGQVQILSPSLASSSKNSTWAYQMQNQQNTGYSPQTLINSRNVGSLQPVWHLNMTEANGTPVITNGTVYVTVMKESLP